MTLRVPPARLPMPASIRRWKAAPSKMPYAARRSYCSWDVDHAGWVVTLYSPEEQDVSGKTLEEVLAWCLVSLMAPELGSGPFLV